MSRLNQQSIISNGSATNYGAPGHLSQFKSRNTNTFKTNGSVNGPSSTKHMKSTFLHSTLDPSSNKLKNLGSNINGSGIPVVVTGDPLASGPIQNKKRVGGTGLGPNKFSQTIVGGGLNGINSSSNPTNLYSMIYQQQNKPKNQFNMVSSYLKGLDQTAQSIRGTSGIMKNSSRNQTLAVPTVTKKAAGRSTLEPHVIGD